MKTSLLTSSKLMTGSLILLLVSVFSINAYSYLLSQGEITGRLAEVEKLKQEQTMKSMETYVYPDRKESIKNCQYYILQNEDTKEIWSCDSEKIAWIIMKQYPEWDKYMWTITIDENGEKILCPESGNGCTPSTCGHKSS